MKSYPKIRLPAVEIEIKLIEEKDRKWHCGYVSFPDQPLNADLISVHGGVTFDETAEGRRTIGFDCIHYGDSHDPTSPNFRDYFYALNAARDMAHQILDQLGGIK